MKVGLGSKNDVKVDALAELLREYPKFNDVEVISFDADSGVSEQPLTLDETVTGAMNRAKASIADTQYGFGIESGLMHVPNTKSGHMDVCVCAIYDGKEYHLGLSSAWEAPELVSKYMLEEGLDMNEAAHKAGLTDNPKVGSAEGLIGIVTRGKLNRKEYTKEAIRAAVIHIDE